MRLSFERFGRAGRIARVAYKVLDRTFDDGFVHAGNLAYLSLTTLFPVFVIIAAVAGSLGRGAYGSRALSAFFAAVPPQVGKLLAGPIGDLVHRSSGRLLTFGIIVGLWSAAGYIETIRDIINRAYGSTNGISIWKRRLASTGAIILTVLLILIAFASQFVLTGAGQFVQRILPLSHEAARYINLSLLAPPIILFVALDTLFASLTPAKYRECCPEWPGALLTTTVWIGATALLPKVIAGVANYQLTYGSLAGVMISLLFFYVVGLGLVTGAHLNAVLAGADPTAAKEDRGEAPTKDNG